MEIKASVRLAAIALLQVCIERNWAFQLSAVYNVTTYYYDHTTKEITKGLNSDGHVEPIYLTSHDAADKLAERIEFIKNHE